MADPSDNDSSVNNEVRPSYPPADAEDENTSADTPLLAGSSTRDSGDYVDGERNSCSTLIVASSKGARRRYLYAGLCLLAAVFSGVMILIVAHLAAGRHSRHSEYQIITADPSGLDQLLAPLPGCHSFSSAKRGSFDFHNISSFHLTEDIMVETMDRFHVGGGIYIRPAPPAQTAAVHIDYEFGGAYLRPGFELADNGAESVSLNQTRASLSVIASEDISGIEDFVRRNEFCLTMKIYVYVNNRVDFENFTIAASHLAVYLVGEGAPFHAEHLTISTVSGDVASTSDRSFAASSTHVEVLNGRIDGSWPLRDNLSLNIGRGSISIGLVLTQHQEGILSTSSFAAAAISGDVNVAYPYVPTAIPLRDYRVSVSTVKGSIYGTYVHGSYTSLIASSGSIEAAIVPLRSASNGSVLYTKSVTQDSRIGVRRPCYTDLEQDPSELKARSIREQQPTMHNFPTAQPEENVEKNTVIHKLHSVHEVVGANLNIAYFFGWQGRYDLMMNNFESSMIGMSLPPVGNTIFSHGFPDNRDNSPRTYIRQQAGRVRHVGGIVGEGDNSMSLSLVDGSLEFMIGLGVVGESWRNV